MLQDHGPSRRSLFLKNAALLFAIAAFIAVVSKEEIVVLIAFAVFVLELPFVWFKAGKVVAEQERRDAGSDPAPRDGFAD